MSSYRIRYLLAAPIILVVGLAGAFWGRKAVAFGSHVQHWADSLDHGSGTVRIVMPLPIYIAGTRVGNLDTIVVERHLAHSMDSVRLVVRPLASANTAALSSCALRVQTFSDFDPSDYPNILNCAADTSGLTRFGTVVFGGGHETALFVDSDQATCIRPAALDSAAPAASRVDVAVGKAVACQTRAALNSAEMRRVMRDVQVQVRHPRAVRLRGLEGVSRAAEAARQAAEAARQAGKQHNP